MNPFWMWTLFGVVIAGMLVLDLGILDRKPNAYTLRSALLRSLGWVALAMGFMAAIYFWQGREKAFLFLTGYLVEESLSVDNLFVFLAVFSFFRVPAAYQHKVLFWGILGAVVMRFAFIFLGIGLIHRFHWLLYVFGVFLIFTGAQLLRKKSKEPDPEKNWLLRLLRPILPFTREYHGGRFFIRDRAQWVATPLFVALLVVEATDILFALDSIPAILSITTDTFIVYTSNIFAILGLRAFFFALSGVMQLFRYLHYGLAAILSFVGVKMLIADLYAIPPAMALAVVAGVLAVTIAASALSGAGGKKEP